MQLLFVLLLVVILAQAFAEICKLLKLPRVVGQITAGIVLGIPYFHSWLFTGESINVIQSLADIGTILLFFFVGLEINILQFERNMKESLKISIMNTAIPFALGFLLSSALGMPLVKALIIGVCLSVSAQSISIDFLEEMKLMKTRIGQIIITSGAVDDIVELILVSVVLATISTAIGGSNILMLLGGMLLFVVLIIIGRVYVLPRVLKLFERSKDMTSLFTGALIITLLMAALSEKFGLGSLMGAMIAGVLVRQILIKKGARVEEEHITNIIHIISFGFLVPIFFVWIGMNTNMTDVFNNAWFTLALIVIAFVGTIGGTMLGVLWAKGTKKEGFIVGWGLNPKGDVELVIASLAFSKGILNSSDFSALIFMALVTTFVSPIVFRWLIKDYSEKELGHASMVSYSEQQKPGLLSNLFSSKTDIPKVIEHPASLEQHTPINSAHSSETHKEQPEKIIPLDESTQIPQTIESSKINIIYSSQIGKKKKTSSKQNNKKVNSQKKKSKKR